MAGRGEQQEPRRGKEKGKEGNTTKPDIGTRQHTHRHTHTHARARTHTHTPTHAHTHTNADTPARQSLGLSPKGAPTLLRSQIAKWLWNIQYGRPVRIDKKPCPCVCFVGVEGCFLSQLPGATRKACHLPLLESHSDVSGMWHDKMAKFRKFNH